MSTTGDDRNYPFTKADKKRRAGVSAAVDRCVGVGGRPRYDSVVIAAGNGVGSYAFAARLARSEHFAGKVVLAGKPVKETRQLNGGVSLRGITADYISYLLNVPLNEFVDHATGNGRTKATTYGITVNMGYQNSSGEWQNSRNAPWLGGQSGLDRPLLFGARNSRTSNAIRELSALDGLTEVDTEIESLEDARSLAPGKNPLVVNCTTNGGLFGNPTLKPIGVTIGVQMAFKPGPEGLKGPMRSGTTITPLINRDGKINVGIYQPFADPLSPEASWYGLMIRPLDTTDVDSDAEKALIQEELLGLAGTYGLEAVDMEQTLWNGKAPAASYEEVPAAAPGTLELRRACSIGYAGYYADGMLGASVGGLVAAESVLRGVDPNPAIRAALSKWRLYNKLWAHQTTKMATIVDKGTRLSPRVALAYPHTWSKNYWATQA